MNKTTQPSYLFIAGCARSGTTALTRLLNSHEQVYISTENFNFLFRSKNIDFNKNLFKQPQYLGGLIKQGKSMGTLNYIGDKFPGYYLDYNYLIDKFIDAKILFIFRNIFDVAQSYKARKIDPENDWGKGVGRAINEWNMSMINTIKQIENGTNISVVCYEDIFTNPSTKLIDLLNLDPSDQFMKNYKKTTVISRRLSDNRTNILSNQEKYKIMKMARFDLYKTLLDIESKQY